MAISPSAEEGQHEERVAAPPRGGLYLAAAREPALGLVLVTALDGERGQPVVARKQELGLADFFGGGQGLPIARGALLVIAAALVDLPQDDQRDRQVIALTEPPV